MAVEIRFCDGAAGLHVQKKRIFSAPQGCMSKNNGFFLRRRVVRQEFHVEILTPEVSCQEFHVEILTPEVSCQEFYVEILTPEVSCQEFYVEILTPEVSCQEFHVEILTPEVSCQEFHVEILHRSQNLFEKHVLHQKLCIFTLKISLFAHFFLHLPTSLLNTNTYEKK